MLIASPRLRDLGWNESFDDAFRAHAADGLIPARVAVQHRGSYVLYGEAGEAWAELAGRLRGDFVRREPGKLAYENALGARRPTVGDWVAVSVRERERRATIQAILPRRTWFARKGAWERTPGAQILAANIDTAFVVVAATAPRVDAAYIAMAREGGAEAVILVTKADLCPAPPALSGLGAEIVVTSALTGEGLDALTGQLGPGRTVVLLGPSGVGKSTLINALVGAEILRTAAVRRDGEGRHVTVRRELIELPGRGLVIDTPGLRELHSWSASDGVEAAFGEIGALAEHCRFRDCGHRNEPGCAVLEAISTGALDGSRLEDLRRIDRDIARLERKQRQRASTERRRQRRSLSHAARSQRWVASEEAGVSEGEGP